MNPALLSSKNMCWCTPQDFFDKLNEEFRFVLDPAATEKTAKCPLYYTPETDGLSQSWNRGGAVFCNPPYGSEIGKWVKKAYDEAQKGQTIVLLLPARTDTKYFHDYIYGKAEIRFLRGRIRFTDEDGRASDPAPFPSMIVIYKMKGQCKMISLNELAKQIHENAVVHGWWEETRTFPEIVALIHSELSEALEEYRSRGIPRSGKAGGRADRACRRDHPHTGLLRLRRNRHRRGTRKEARIQQDPPIQTRRKTLLKAYISTK